MADFIGHLLGHLPVWLLIPALIVVCIIAFLIAVSSSFIPINGRKAYLGEKRKDGKK